MNFLEALKEARKQHKYLRPKFWEDRKVAQAFYILHDILYDVYVYSLRGKLMVHKETWETTAINVDWLIDTEWVLTDLKTLKKEQRETDKARKENK